MPLVSFVFKNLDRFLNIETMCHGESSDLVNNQEKRLLQYTFVDSKIFSCFDLCPLYLPVIQTVGSIEKVAELCKQYSREFADSNLTSRRMEV